MTSIELLAMLRTLLDETPEGFWKDDADCYPALKEAQIKVVNDLAKVKSITLRPLLIPVHSSALTKTSDEGIDLPADFYLLYNLKASPDGTTEYPCFQRDGDYFKDEDNPYKSSEDSELYFTITYSDSTGSNKQLLFQKDFSSGTLSMDYIKKPSDITSTTNPAIDSAAHLGIVFYAFFLLLVKAKLDNSRAYEMYRTEMEGLT